MQRTLGAANFLLQEWERSVLSTEIFLSAHTARKHYLFLKQHHQPKIGIRTFTACPGCCRMKTKKTKKTGKWTYSSEDSGRNLAEVSAGAAEHLTEPWKPAQAAHSEVTSRWINEVNLWPLGLLVPLAVQKKNQRCGNAGAESRDVQSC